MSQAAAIRDFMARGTSDKVSQVTRRLGLGVLSGVVLRTPVDTGRARGNWQTSVGSSIGDAESGILDKGGAAVINTGMATIARQKAYEPITIQNNVPYITRLNDGSSAQAPAGYVEGVFASLGLTLERG